MNQLDVSLQQTIATLAAKEWSARKIARELGLDRETVRRYLRLQRESKPAIPPTGSSEVGESKPAILPTGFSEETDSKPAIVPAGSKAGRTSQCAGLAEVIKQGLAQYHSAQRIYQDLVVEHQFSGGYDAVKRFVRRLSQRSQVPFRRMECPPGQELQVDFGQGGWVVEQGKRRKTHLFRCVLSHSRKAYSEVVWRQTTESFIRCLENAFRYFGGVTTTVVIDNLKAGVLRADWFDPQLNPKLEEFARHYRTAILPTKPAMPRHKGKVEAGVKYAQNNAVKGRRFASLAEQNQFLLQWERTTADTRIHGTTRQQVTKCFEEVERPALHPLPASLFPVFEEAKRSVHRDGHIEFKRAYYSVPPEYVGRDVWVRQESRLLRIYNMRREQIALHPLAQRPGQWTTDDVHLHSSKRHIIERGADYLLERCRLLGPLTGAWTQAMYQARGPQGLRVMQGLLQLAEKYPASQLEKAAQTSTHHGAWRLRDLKRLLEAPANVVQLDFLETHPLIRPLEAYRIKLTQTPNPPLNPDLL
jgi:transposase